MGRTLASISERYGYGEHFSVLLFSFSLSPQALSFYNRKENRNFSNVRLFKNKKKK